MANKYKQGKYRLSVAGNKDLQNKPVAIYDPEGNDVLDNIGTSYDGLTNKPTINGVELEGNMKFVDIVDGLAFGGVVYYNDVLTPDTSCYYIANGTGTYASFGNVQVYSSERVQMLYYDNTQEAWMVDDLPWYNYNYIHGKVDEFMDLQGLIPSDADPDTNLLATENFVHDAKAFKGWFDSSSDLTTAYPSPVVGDFAYVHDASPATTVSIYRCATAGTWADSGDDVDTSLVQTFASGQPLNEVNIIDNIALGGDDNIPNAAAVKDELYFLDEGKTIVTPVNYTITGFVRPAGTLSDNSSYRMAKVFASEYEGCKTITIKTKAGSTSASPICFFDSNDAVIKIDNTPVSVTPTSAEASAVTEYSIAIPEGSAYFLSSMVLSYKEQGASGFKGVAVYDENLKEHFSAALDYAYKNINNRSVYVSKNGDDSNNGLSESTPLRTVNKAMRLFSRNMNLVIMQGDYTEIFDFGYFRKVIGMGKVRIIAPQIKFTSFEPLDGYSRVYVTSLNINPNVAISFWQQDVDDVNTEITDRLSQHGSLTYRLPHTRLLHADSISAIENDTTYYRWYVDAVEHKLYISTPSNDFVNHPICIPYANVIKVEYGTFDIENVEFHFNNLCVLYSHGTLKDVKSFCSAGAGGLIWDGSVATFDHCEAGGCYGDGINGHTSGVLTCIDCYAHDNGDDGESCHEDCMVSQIGGLYEYNANGCTPAFGASGNYVATIVRNNQKTYPWATDVEPTSGSGFSAQGGATMSLNSCLSYGNRIGIQKGTNDSVVAINCKSLSNTSPDSSGIVVF